MNTVCTELFCLQVSLSLSNSEYFEFFKMCSRLVLIKVKH